MDRDSLAKVVKTVYAQNPKLAGIQPKVSKDIFGNTLLIFTSKGTLPGGKSLNQNIRVVVDPNGKINKISSSR